jgi:hypothetical protein
VNHIAQAAYMAKNCIECIHDLTSLDTAGQALNNYSSVLAQHAPEDQKAALLAYEDLPSLSPLFQAFKDAGAVLCKRNSASALAHVS